MARAALESVISSLNVNIFAILFVAFSTNAVADDIVTELKKNKYVTEPNLYILIQGLNPTNDFYENVSDMYENASLERPLCLYLLNMHLSLAVFLDQKTKNDIDKISSIKEAIDYGFENAKPLDLRYLGVMAPIEIYKKQTQEIEIKQNGFWINTYIENKEKIKTCLSQLLNIKDKPKIYDVSNIKNTLLEAYYTGMLSVSRLKLAENFTLFAYDTVPWNSYINTVFDKQMSSELKDIVNKLKELGIKSIQPGGPYEAATSCNCVTDSYLADTNRNKDMTEVSCKVRLLREECTDTSYMINKSISQYMDKQDRIKILRIYEIQAYEQNGKKLKINKPNTLLGKKTSNWDYHVASLIIFKDLISKELYIAINDNFFSQHPMTLKEWTGLFSNSQKIKYVLVPFIRVKGKETLYTTLKMAEKEAEEKRRTPEYR